MNELLILDVAHGNSALLISNNVTAIFDTAPKDILYQVLVKYNIKIIDYLFISHSDKDHLGGLLNLLSSNQIKIRRIFLNPDSTKKGSNIRKLRIAINDAIKRSNLIYDVIHTAKSGLQLGEVILDVLYPTVADLLSGPGGVDSKGIRIDSNSSSAIFRIKHDNHPIALFAADMTQRNLDIIAQETPTLLKADILVFPHHGGICADDNSFFAEKIISYVNPKFTVFSLGRDAFLNPRPEIITAIKRATSNTCIMCTQLSKNCLSHLPDDRTHWENYVNDLPGAGRTNTAFCAGSLRITLKGVETIYPDSQNHRSFIESNIPNALCSKI